MTIVDHQARTSVPDWLLIQQMDRCVRIAADATRVHDTLAAELGYRRVSVNTVREGDRLVIGHTDHTVVCAQHYTDEISSWYRVTLHCTGFDPSRDSQHTETFDDGELVSVRIPDIPDPF